MGSRWPLTCALVGMAALVFPISSVADDSAADDGESYWDRHFDLRFQVTHNSYSDVRVRERRLDRNDLALAFVQPTVVAENVAEENSWRQTAEMLNLVYEPFGKDPQSLGIFIGVGAAQGSLDVGTERVSLGTDPIYAFGLLGTIGHIGDFVRFDWEAQVTRTEGESTDLDQFVGFEEKVKILAYNYGGRLTAAFNLYPDAGPEPDAVAFEPYIGVLYYHLLEKEELVVGSGGTRTQFEFDIESESRSDVRGILGLRLVGLEGRSNLSIEGSYGEDSFGIGLIADVRF